MSDLQIVDIDGAANGSDCYLCVKFSSGAHYEILLPDMPEGEWSLIVDVYEENTRLRQELEECHRAIAIFCREETEFSFAGDKPAIEWFIGEYSEDNFEGGHP